MYDINGQTIILTRGDTASAQLIPTLSATGEPYEFVEGDKVMFRIRQLPAFGPVFEKDCPIDVANNICILTIDPEDTENFEMTEYRYECELIDTNGAHYTFIANQKFIVGKELEDHGTN